MYNNQKYIINVFIYFLAKGTYVILIMAQFLGKARCYSCNGTLCLQPTQDQIKECNLKQNTCQFSMSGFTPKSFSVERSCGPANTSIHQCIGLRKESSMYDWPKDEKSE